jgi:hypothetical protein
MPSPAETALLDQLSAATNHARSFVHALAHTEGTPVQTTASMWTRLQLLNVALAITSGQVHHCPHLGDSPTLIHAAVWAPGRLVCSACTSTLDPSPTEDDTCDRCRAPGQELYGCTVAVGPLILAYGLCTPCLNATHHNAETHAAGNGDG